MSSTAGQSLVKENRNASIFWSELGVLLVWILALVISNGNLKSQKYNLAKKSGWVPDATALLTIWFFFILFFGYSFGVSNSYKTSSQRTVLVLFIINLLLTLLWFWLFFNKQNYQSAAIVAVLIFLLTLWQLYLTWNVDRTAAYFQIVYAIWLFFVLLVNWNLYSLN